MPNKCVLTIQSPKPC